MRVVIRETLLSDVERIRHIVKQLKLSKYTWWAKKTAHCTLVHIFAVHIFAKY